MTLTDTHTHLYSKQFTYDREDMIQRALEAGVTRLFLPNVDGESIPGMLELAAKYPQNCFPMMGLHPCHVKENAEAELETVRRWLFEKMDDTGTVHPDVSFCAVGEIGLDYHWDLTFREQQKAALKLQTGWAKELGLPIVIHSRESFDDIIVILEELADDRLRGVFHCFTGTAAQARRAMDLGFYLGIGGVVTYKNSGLAEVMKEINLDRIILETDAPYLAPVPHRGKRNESAYVRLVAEKLADTLGVTTETVAEKTTANSIDLFGF
ncbi:TatD family hydrolase [soil metagenome]